MFWGFSVQMCLAVNVEGFHEIAKTLCWISDKYGDWSSYHLLRGLSVLPPFVATWKQMFRSLWEAVPRSPWIKMACISAWVPGAEGGSTRRLWSLSSVNKAVCFLPERLQHWFVSWSHWSFWRFILFLKVSARLPGVRKKSEIKDTVFKNTFKII